MACGRAHPAERLSPRRSRPHGAGNVAPVRIELSRTKPLGVCAQAFLNELEEVLVRFWEVVAMHVYIDGESHFIRSEQCVKERLGREGTLDRFVGMVSDHWQRLKQELDVRVDFFIVLEHRCKFFWNGDLYPSLSNCPKVYFTSFAGDEDALHGLRVSLRAAGFEPQIIKERSLLAKQRGNALGNEGLIEKAKSVDIALAVRMLEDAQRNVFTECALFTSDVDYLPVIEAVQRMGKLVRVYGYRSGLGKNSPLEYVPDRFIDMEIAQGDQITSITVKS